MKQEIWWRCSDGMMFEMKQEAEWHEAALESARRVDLWLSRREELTDRQKAHYRRVVLEWEEYRADIEPQMDKVGAEDGEAAEGIAEVQTHVLKRDIASQSAG